MQTIQNHVVSLDLAKKLVEVGIKIKTHFAWAEVATGEKDMVGMPEWEWRVVPNDFQAEIEFYPAPLASELGEVLPRTVTKSGVEYFWACAKGEKSPYTVSYLPRTYEGHLVTVPSDRDIPVQTGETEANARATMLIYLKEKGLI